LLGTTAIAATFGILSIAFLREHIATIFLAKPYRSSSNLLPWIALGHGFLVISYVFEKVCYAYKRTQSILLIQITGASASLLIGIPLIYYFGLFGAAVSIPIYFGVQLVISMYVARSVLKVR
jgi:O-antigen/teichoic acid export membrane protein